MRYAMLICGDMDDWETEPPEVSAVALREVYAWFEKWQATGKIADAGAGLQHPRTGRTVRAGADGRPVVTDGPYLELKEVIGGFVMLEADDLDDATAVASTWPGLAYGRGASVEVRPVEVH